MVKNYYACEICGNRYEKRKEAVDCEAKKEMKQEFPIGTICGYTGGDDMVFVICRFIPDNHHAHYGLWGFRDTPTGDNAPKDIEEIKNPRNTCGFTQYYSGKIQSCKSPNRKLACYKRAKETMKKFGIKTLDYKEQRIKNEVRNDE